LGLIDPDTVNCWPVLIAVVEIETEPVRLARDTVMADVGSESHAVW
jgi:hypothetical protein